MSRKILVVVLCGVLGLLSVVSHVHRAQAGGCTIDHFWVSPGLTVQEGTVVTFDRAAHCDPHMRAMRQTFNGRPWGEGTLPQDTRTWNTHDEFGPGNYTVCLQAAADGDNNWAAIAQTCISLTVLPNNSSSQPVSCQISNISPSYNVVVHQNEALQISAAANCSSGVRAMRILVNGSETYQFGGPNISWTWPGAPRSNVLWSVCVQAAGQGDDSWIYKAERCFTIQVEDVGNPMQPLNPPSDNGSSSGGSNGSSSSGEVVKIPEARQSNIPGGVDLITVCYVYGYTDAGNSNGTAEGWYCSGNGQTWRVDWNKVCRDVYGSGYIAVKLSNDQNDVRCQKSGGGYSGGQSGTGSQPPVDVPPLVPKPAGGMSVCSGAPTSHMVGVTHGRSTLGGASLWVRSDPAGSKIRQIPNGQEFDIIAGPTCHDNRVWWYIRTSFVSGWVMEGDFDAQYIEPWGDQGDVRGGDDNSSSGSGNSGGNSSGTSNNGGNSGSSPSRITLKAPFNDCKHQDNGSVPLPRTYFAIASKGFSSVSSFCDPTTGEISSKMFLLGGTDGGLAEEPSHKTQAFSYVIAEYSPQFTGTLLVEVTILAKGKSSTGAGSALAIPDLFSVIRDFLLEHFLEERIGDLGAKIIGPLIDIGNTIVNPTAAKLCHTAILEVDNGQQIYLGSKSIYQCSIVTFPSEKMLDSQNFHSEVTMVSLQVPVVAGRKVIVRTGMKTEAEVYGWATVSWNFRKELSRVDSIVFTQVR